MQKKNFQLVHVKLSKSKKFGQPLIFDFKHDICKHRSKNHFTVTVYN